MLELFNFFIMAALISVGFCAGIVAGMTWKSRKKTVTIHLDTLINGIHLDKLSDDELQQRVSNELLKACRNYETDYSYRDAVSAQEAVDRNLVDPVPTYAEQLRKHEHALETPYGLMNAAHPHLYNLLASKGYMAYPDDDVYSKSLENGMITVKWAYKPRTIQFVFTAPVTGPENRGKMFYAESAVWQASTMDAKTVDEIEKSMLRMSGQMSGAWDMSTRTCKGSCATSCHGLGDCVIAKEHPWLTATQNNSTRPTTDIGEGTKC